MKTKNTISLLGALFFGSIAVAQTYVITLDDPYIVNQSGVPQTTDIAGIVENYTRDIAIDPRTQFAVYGTNYHVDNVAWQGIARTKIDGSIDTDFNPGSNPYTGYKGYALVEKIHMYPDGSMLIGGQFIADSSSSNTNHFAKLNADGSPNTSFNENLGSGFGGLDQRPADANPRDIAVSEVGVVKDIAVQSDGKIIVVGIFRTFNGETVNHIVRLNADGTRDNSFNNGGIGFGTTNGHLAEWTVNGHGLYVYPSGPNKDKIIVTGRFNTYNGQSIPYGIMRLNKDGSIDESFDVGTAAGGGFNPKYYWINSVTLQSDGKIVAYGNFNGKDGPESQIYGELGQQNITRLGADGGHDATFHGNSQEIFDVVLLRENKLLVVGAGTADRVKILNADGTLDTDYDFGAGSAHDIQVAALQKVDGVSDRILLGGIFDALYETPRIAIARLHSPQALPIRLASFSAEKVGKEVELSWTTSFERNNRGFAIERSTDGKAWSEIEFVGSQADGGNSSEQLSYQFLDAQPMNGVNFYRLKQMDYDGQFMYSVVRQVRFSGIAKAISVYPNPANMYVTIEGLENAATINVVNVAGQVVRTANSKESTKVQVDLQGLATGMYYIRVIQQDGSAQVEKVMVQ